VRLSQDFRGKGSSLGDIFWKTRHILLSGSANCTVLRADVLTQYRRVTDGQTDGIATSSTALAMRALRCTVIMAPLYFFDKSQKLTDFNDF